MISVALCTYNGEQYIEEQLSSILNQSQKVDEIVVCDDGSTDRTIDIVKRIARCNNDVNIRVFINDTTLGVCRNFEKAIYKCSGDIIFLSDQDDVWMQNKVEIIVNWFEKNQDKAVVFTDAFLIDENGLLLYDSQTLWNFTGMKNDKIKRQYDNGYAFEILASENRCVGATMALRRNFRFEFSIFAGSRVLHDDIIAMSALLNNALGYIEFPSLMKYRIHDSQIVGIKNKNLMKSHNMYSINSKSMSYVLLPMSKYFSKRLELFILRSNVPKKTILKIHKYLVVYKSKWIYFWFHDITKLINYLMKK